MVAKGGGRSQAGEVFNKRGREQDKKNVVKRKVIKNQKGKGGAYKKKLPVECVFAYQATIKRPQL